jgi:hypothetical protein
MQVKRREKTGGRQKGTPNKTTSKLKEAVLNAFEQVGGTGYLVKVAQEDPKTFVTLLGKLLPAEMKADISSEQGAIVVIKDFTGEAS